MSDNFEGAKEGFVFVYSPEKEEISPQTIDQLKMTAEEL